MKTNVATPAHHVIPSEAEGSGPNAGISPLRDAPTIAPVEMTQLEDRLAAAQTFANELNEFRLWKIKISYQKRWTTHRRAKKAVEIQITKPWKHSTGPKTLAGKSRTRLNALYPDAGFHAMKDALRLHNAFLRTVRLLTRMLKNAHPDANTLAAHSHRLGLLAANAMTRALALSERDFPSSRKFPA